MLALILIIGSLSVLAACTTTRQGLSETNGNTDTGYLLENMGYTILLPDGYHDKVTLLPSNELDSNIIIAAYQTATFEEYPGAGFLFRIVRHTPAEFEQYWPDRDMIGGSDHFAKDESYYYSMEFPTDVQAFNDIEGYQTLAEQESTIRSWFIANNNLTEYDHGAAVYAPEYTYPGIHAIFSVVLSNDAKFDVILSKPIRQGTDGIWCVERMYDEYKHLYMAIPETDITAMEYYTQLQAEVDTGHQVGLLDAENVALTYLENVWDFARHIKNSNIRYTEK